MRKVGATIAVSLTALGIWACSTPGSAGSAPVRAAQQSVPTLSPPALDAGSPADYPGLHNLVTYAPGLISGSAPDGTTGFDTLSAIGVKTIISVDGARPDIDAARARGLRYIHLPIGYGGMDDQRTLEIARAVELARRNGPVYLHCHHGKHRSAGAAGAAAVMLGLLTNQDATARMRVSGTAPNYRGLYQCVADAGPADRQALDAVNADFPETWKTSGLVQTMVEIDGTFDNLRAIEAAGWKTPPDSPDLVPAAEAGRIADLLRTLRDDPQAASKPADFGERLAHASTLATAVEEGLKAARPDGRLLSTQLKSLGASCKECHAKYRD